MLRIQVLIIYLLSWIANIILIYLIKKTSIIGPNQRLEINGKQIFENFF